MAGTAVQFKGANQVLEAYRMREVDAWAIFCYKELFTKGIGAEELKAALDLLKRSDTQATYILRVYEDIEDAKLIKDKTPADGAFGFVMSEGGSSASRSYYEMEERLKKLEGGDKEDEDKSIMGKIGNTIVGLLENPAELVQVLGAIKQLFQTPGPIPAMAVGNVVRQFVPVSDQKNESVNMETEIRISEDEKLQRLSNALDTLEKHDPDIVVHLEKLAKIASEEPGVFKIILMNLSSY